LKDSHDFLNHLVGRWMLIGKMGEIELRQLVTAKWILGDTFLWMHSRSVTPQENPTYKYEAVYHLGYNENEQTYVMHLLDTTEVPLKCVVGLGERAGNTLPFLFEYGQTKFFNTFVWHPEDSKWSFHQTFEEEGIIQTFATKKMTRLPAEGA